MRRYGLFVAAFTIAAIACGDSTSPETRSLDGAWSTGHTIVGLELGLALTWTERTVHGTGGYALANDSLACGTTTPAIPGNGTVTLNATRPAVDRVSGSLQFDGGATIPFDGTVVDSSRINGSFARIEATITAPDGTKCAWGLIHALVP